MDILKTETADSNQSQTQQLPTNDMSGLVTVRPVHSKVQIPRNRQVITALRLCSILEVSSAAAAATCCSKRSPTADKNECFVLLPRCAEQSILPGACYVLAAAALNNSAVHTTKRSLSLAGSTTSTETFTSMSDAACPPTASPSRRTSPNPSTWCRATPLRPARSCTTRRAAAWCCRARLRHRPTRTRPSWGPAPAVLAPRKVGWHIIRRKLCTYNPALTFFLECTSISRVEDDI